MTSRSSLDAPTFLDKPLDELVASWSQELEHDPRQTWLKEFERRYLDLAGSRLDGLERRS